MAVAAGSKQSGARPGVVLPGLLALAVFGLLVALGARQIDDVDYWWHLKTGEVIARAGIPRQELFTWTRAGTARVESSWLYCLALYRIDQLLGPAWLVLGKAGLIALAFIGAALPARGRGTVLLGAPCVAIAALAASQRFGLRPEVLSYLFLSLFLALITRRLARPTRAVWTLPILGALWANTHSLFVLGPVMLVIWAVCELAAAGARRLRGVADPSATRRLAEAAALTLLTSAAAFVNPYGAELVLVPLRQFGAVSGADLARPSIALAAGVVSVTLLLAAGWTLIHQPREPAPGGSAGSSGTRQGSLSALGSRGAALLLLLAPAVLALALVPARPDSPDKAFIAELASPFRVSQHFTALVYFKAIVALTIIAVACSPHSIGLFRIAVTAAGLALAALAVRNIPLFVLPALGLLLSAGEPMRARLAEIGARPGYLRFPAGRVAAGVLAGATVALCLYHVRALSTNRFYIAQGDTGRSGLAIAHTAVPTGTADLLLSLGQPQPLFNTQRLGSYLLWRGIRVFIDSRAAAGIIPEYRALTDSPEPENLDAFIDRYGLRAIAIDTDALDLLALMRDRADWRLVHAEPAAALFLRSDTGPSQPALVLDQAWLARARANLQAPTDYNARGWLTRLASPIPFQRLARLCLLYGRHREALSLFEDALRCYPPRFTDDAAMGYAALASAEFRLALDAFERLLQREPGSLAAMLGAAEALIGAGDLDRAIGLTRRALEADPGSARAHYLAGTIALKRGDADAAIASLQRAAALNPSDADTLANLGTALALRGATGEAIATLEAAFRLSPHDPSIATDLALLQYSVARRADARRWAEVAWRLRPGDPRLKRILDSP